MIASLATIEQIHMIAVAAFEAELTLCLWFRVCFPRRNFQKPPLVRDSGTIQIAGSRMGPVGFLQGSQVQNKLVPS